MKRSLAIIALILLADQALKFWVKLSFFYDSSVRLAGDWAFLHFIENRGMAFGMEFGGEFGKLLLTLLRIAAVVGLGWYLRRLHQEGAHRGLTTAIALVFAGALGNIIDSTFYGVIFSQSTHFTKAVLFPEGGGYAPLFQGAVVDMFYFPLWEGRLPHWLPWVGGDHFVFFRPVFNIADAAITVGVALFVIFQGRRDKVQEQAAENATTPSPDQESTA